MPLDQSEALKAVEKLPDAGRRHAEAACEIQFIDGGTGARIVAEHPLHEPLLDLSRKRLGLGNGKASGAGGALGGSHHAMRPAPTDNVATGELRQHLTHCRTADAQSRLEGVLRRQSRAIAEEGNQIEGVVEGAFENCVGLHAALR